VGSLIGNGGGGARGAIRKRVSRAAYSILGLNSLMYARGQIVDLPPYMKYSSQKSISASLLVESLKWP
jgi:hypothetical protein